ncbi:unnamed protein product [Rotaria sordida]|uniref:Uncharacterized protein n=1 Tax=Rotaria sordida TaxID=392033 RepID=A0A814TPE1_9BILA|nr:unnamed protein product [Rotaria sordida]CAF1172985.1 unnamed protein product [Rotaria sordida]CAF3676587.1 unnamed protein product [Rotaria sordida]CAF3705988.1 unnamed protein product [Rotaria sordida]
MKQTSTSSAVTPMMDRTFSQCTSDIGSLHRAKHINIQSTSSTKSSLSSCASNMSLSSSRLLPPLTPLLKAQQRQQQEHNRTIKQMSSNRFSIPNSLPSIRPSQINRSKSCLLHEAKMFKDPYFNLLWRIQKAMQPYAETAGGRTTFLRSLRRKLN